MQKILYLVLFQFFYSIHSCATVRILTFHCNLPHLLEMQCKALNKFMIEDFELIVLDDAQDPYVESELKRISEKYGALHVRFKPKWHKDTHLNEHFRLLMEKFPPVKLDQASRSWRHSRMIQYGLETYGYSHDDIVVILDGDAFPIRTISLKQMLEFHPIVGSLRKGAECEYFMPVFVAFDPKKLENPSEFQLHWDYFFDNYQDTGAYTFYYFKEHPEINVLKIPFIRGDTLSGYSQAFIKDHLDPREQALVNLFRNFYYEIHMDWHIFHFKGSSFNLRPERTRRVFEFLETILSEECPPLRRLRIDPNAITQFPGDDHE